MIKNILRLSDEDTARVVPILFAYLFDRINKYEYRRLIADKALAKEVWSAAESSGYILKHCKLFVWAHNHSKRNGISVSPAKFEVYRDDAAILRKIDLPKIKSKYRPYSVFDFDNLEGAILTSAAMNAYIGKFVSRKLIFLRSYGLTREAISSHLISAALFALRKHYPVYESELHALNICKTAIHNAGMGLIEYWTRGKRNALIKENGTFQAVHVQYDVLSCVSVPPEHEEEIRVNLKSLVALADTLPVRDQQFLSAAAGIYDAGVSLFIGVDNSNAVDRWGYQRYLTHLRHYFGFTAEQQSALLDDLRSRMT